MKIRKNWLIALIAIPISLLYFSCGEDDDTPPIGTLDPIASFQYAVDPVNFLQVSFSNFSQNADTYTWNFGDGQSSTEVSPVHTYASAGTYTVVLQATNAEGKTVQRSETITLADPDAVLALLAGDDSKDWYLLREGVALGIGPVPGDNQWWSFGGVTPLGDRPCVLDDVYTFHRSGQVSINTNNTIFVDSDGNGGWMGDGSAEGCFDESTPGLWNAATGEDLSAFANGGDYTYVFDQSAGTITIEGAGFYIGLANKTADGDNYIPLQTKVYQVYNLAEGAIADTLSVALANDAQSWNFNLVSYHDISNLPDIPTAQVRAAFEFTRDGHTVTFKNLSSNAIDYSWDFGDGGSSTERDPVHTYAADGEYTVTLTSFGDGGTSDQVSAVVQISSATYTSSVLSSVDGKVWKLDGAFSYFVGPAKGSGEWWGGVPAEELTMRECQFNDEYIFFDDNTFQYDSKGDVFFEDYLGGTNICIDEGELPAPYDAFASGTYTFTATDSDGTNDPTIVLNGVGAFLGFSKAFNGGEINGTIEPSSSITYEVIDYVQSGGKEIITVAVDISEGQVGGAYWNMRLISE